MMDELAQYPQYPLIAADLLRAIIEVGLDSARGVQLVPGPATFETVWNSLNPILSHDLEERINFCNPAACERFGYERREFMELLSEMLVPENLRAARKEVLKRVIETGQPEYFEDSSRMKNGGETTMITGWAFRYSIFNQYSIGALLLP